MFPHTVNNDMTNKILDGRINIYDKIVHKLGFLSKALMSSVADG